jgi:PAS domain-containing protein
MVFGDLQLMELSDNEVNFADTDQLVSITDLKGIITYANEEFWKLLGTRLMN